jgi:hypothetical protein
VFNLARQILGRDDCDEELAIAAAFHDLGIWSDHTFDYLAPSAERALNYARTSAPSADTALIAGAIALHHKLRRVADGPHPGAVEAFRRADLVDVSRGVVRAGLARGLVRELTTQFPYDGFHGVLVKTAFAWCIRHPLRPFPMLRW